MEKNTDVTNIYPYKDIFLHYIINEIVSKIIDIIVQYHRTLDRFVATGSNNQADSEPFYWLTFCVLNAKISNDVHRLRQGSFPSNKGRYDDGKYYRHAGNDKL